jgi:hypothetical protein
MEEFLKLVVFVPATHSDAVREAIAEAGGGRIGNYSFCSFSVKGIGRFRPEAGANPAIGQVGKLEEVEEERIEITCRKSESQKIITAIKKVHPYEEIVIDAYPTLVLD